jgi:hypothetical protein
MEACQMLNSEACDKATLIPANGVKCGELPLQVEILVVRMEWHRPRNAGEVQIVLILWLILLALQRWRG